jgi:hypothetical protein
MIVARYQNVAEYKRLIRKNGPVRETRGNGKGGDIREAGGVGKEGAVRGTGVTR